VSAKDISNMLVTWLGLMAAIIGGHAAYQQYRESVNKQVDDRSTAAINFVMQFQNLQMLPVREKIHGYIFCQADCAAKTPTSSELFAFVEFFDAIKYCADKRLCDPEIIGEVFGPYATWHWPCLAGSTNAAGRGGLEAGATLRARPREACRARCRTGSLRQSQSRPISARIPQRGMHRRRRSICLEPPTFV
jgi:hypothetical protein